MNSKNIYKELNDFFTQEPSIDQKAWDVIHDFYHQILTFMEDENHQISKAELARRLKQSRPAISQMFTQTPNITIKKMVQIANALGLELKISAVPFAEQKAVIIPICEDDFIDAAAALSPPKQSFGSRVANISVDLPNVSEAFV